MFDKELPPGFIPQRVECDAEPIRQPVQCFAWRAANVEQNLCGRYFSIFQRCERAFDVCEKTVQERGGDFIRETLPEDNGEQRKTWIGRGAARANAANAPVAAQYEL